MGLHARLNPGGSPAGSGNHSMASGASSSALSGHSRAHAHALLEQYYRSLASSPLMRGFSPTLAPPFGNGLVGGLSPLTPDYLSQLPGGSGAGSGIGGSTRGSSGPPSISSVSSITLPSSLQGGHGGGGSGGSGGSGGGGSGSHSATGVPGSSNNRLSSPTGSGSSKPNRKRALSHSPSSDFLDLESITRASPTSLELGTALSLYGNIGARSGSSASGSYGHLSAGTVSPGNLHHQHSGLPHGYPGFPAAFMRPGSSAGVSSAPSATTSLPGGHASAAAAAAAAHSAAIAAAAAAGHHGIPGRQRFTDIYVFAATNGVIYNRHISKVSYTYSSFETNFRY